MTNSWDSLPGLFPGFESSARWLPILQEHARLLAAAGPAIRVTSVPVDQWPERHYAEALELLRLILDARGGVAPRSLIDVGSGGGFPGLVIAAVLPGTAVWLIEPLQKRARLLHSLAAELGLANIEVVSARAEEAGRGPLRESADMVTARAVAGLRELLEYTAPLARADGLLALPKGSGLERELESAASAMELLGVEEAGSVAMRPLVTQTLRVAFFKKVGATPQRFPRRAGMAAKRPL
ncbi:MAG: 16S rRNA (guanine(527)-N(7))-methyltransferase RsmG [Tepidiformaceae bacterium]